MSAEQVKSAEQRALETNAGLLAQKVLEGIEVPVSKEAKVFAINSEEDDDKNKIEDPFETVFISEDDESEVVPVATGKRHYSPQEWGGITTLSVAAVSAYLTIALLVHNIFLPAVAVAGLYITWRLARGAWGKYVLKRKFWSEVFNMPPKKKAAPKAATPAAGAKAAPVKSK